MLELSNVKDKLAKLVDDYNEKANILGQNEARTRQYLIDPFWEALGWDMRNPDHVDVESNVQSDELDLTGEEPTGIKRADYTFLHSYNKTAFVVEAKKPKVSLRDEKVINQLKRYGFTLGIDIGILHDFEEFRAFDTAFPVTPRPEINLIKEFDIGYEQYPDLADKLLETFGREAVLGGSIQRLVGRVRKGKSTIPVDRHFLDMLKDWRKDLAIGLANQNPAYSIHDINEYVGRILNRIIFLRVVEERHALTGKPLQGAWNDYRRYSDVGAKVKLYEQLKPFFLEMNEIFNGVLFKPTDWDDMKVPDPPVYDMLREIYNPLVPYDFGVIPVELLGTIYERFLGEVVVREDDEVKIEIKPEVRKAGGVYYTPKYIVDYIVEQTVGKLIEGKTPEQIRKIKILDPACGSGSFLIGAYEKLMKYHLEWFKKHPKKIKRGMTKADAYVDGDNNWRLGFHVKQEILVNNIFGVDIDGRAVEVTMLSLYLKLMEDETYLTLEGMKYLPDLNDNIKCGNSLIGWDIADMDILPEDPNERQAELERINPFDWEREFPQIFTPLNKGGQGGSGGFDAVIGNPPYVRPHKIESIDKKYFWAKYDTFEKKADLYCSFVEKGHSVLKEGGHFGFIISNGFLRLDSFEALRNYLLARTSIKKILDFTGNVFDDAMVKAAILIDEKKKKAGNIVEVKTLPPGLINEAKPYNEIEQSAFNETYKSIFDLSLNETRVSLKRKLESISHSLGKSLEIAFGLKTGDDSVFLSYEPGDTNEYKRLLRGEDIHRYFHQFKGEYVWYVPNEMRNHRTTARPGTAERFERPKILVRDTGDELEAAFDDEHYVKDVLVVYSENNSVTDLKYVLGLLNSKLMTYYYTTSFPTLHVQRNELAHLPIRTIDFSNPDDVAKHDRMVSLVDDMLALNKRLRETESPSTRKSIEAQISHTDRAIDNLVYDLYALTPEEIAIVEGSTK